MFELRRPSLRLAMALALGAVSFVEVQALASTLEGQARLREQVIRTLRQATESARPALAAQIGPGGGKAWEDAMREARARGLAAEAAVLDLEGHRLGSTAIPPRISDSLSREDAEILRADGTLTLGPVMGESSRLLTYLGLRSGDERVALLLAAPVPELVEDLRQRRPLFVAHGIAILLLLVATALVLFPSGEPPRRSAALGAYQEAIERLQQRSERDRAHLRRVEEDLEDAAALARSGELAAGIAHEVRNGLGTIVGYARLAERGALPVESIEAVEAIRQECDTLESVITRFVDFVRDEKLNRASFDLSRTLRRVVARESRNRTTTVSTDLPEAEAPAAFDGDEDLLERALENLVRNALDAAGPEGHVELRLTRDATAFFVIVADDGPGLVHADGQQPRPFLSTKPRGLGLGLPIAVKITRLHGGDLVLSNREPHGLTVTLRLPLPAQTST